MTTAQYIDNINKRYLLGNATEHTFRGDLQQLLETLVPDIRATNEPKRQSCGAPDYILTKKDNLSRESGIPVGFIEAKDIGDKDLSGAKKTGNKEQFDRYKASLNNLIFTDYLDFHLYRDGVFVTKIAIAELREGNGLKPIVVALPENFAAFENLIKEFCATVSQSIKSSKRLAEMMAGKARLLSDVIERALTSDETQNEDSTLKDQMLAFKQILIHDITPKGFADVYAQTIAYGMFAARLHDPTLPTFSRQEAAELIPKSNPFLRKLFGYIAGPDIDDRIKWIVDSLVEIFLACNVEEILKNYGKQFSSPSGGGREGADPIIHFYETFLSEYDPKLRKARGVWYTPAPVVNFIVRAVDDILKTEFDLPNGLADTSKLRITNAKLGIDREVHKVQILDPATGTGTFLAEVVKHIHKKFEGQQGIWSNYVETHLLPRLNGFELLMASYAMAHLKLDLLLTETGYKPTTNQRFRVYLTNSLEEHHQDTGTLFANWLSSEANEANHIKRDTPVMCVIGNPPYSGESANKGEWIMSLMEDYKKEPGGKEKLKERNPKIINADENKFIRYGQHFIEKNGSGILAFINPHTFLDASTLRGMRWHLLKTFDKIYTIDLHGNSTKKEVCPDGTPDHNVFDIMQGVSINLFIKSGKKKVGELGQVFHYDIHGKRELKYDFLCENYLESIKWNKLQPNSPNFFFVNKNFNSENENSFFQVEKLFGLYNSGLTTEFDELVIQEKLENSLALLDNLKTRSTTEIAAFYNLGQNKLDKISNAKSDVNLNKSTIKNIYYRPFDHKYTLYTGKINGIMGRPRNELMRHFFDTNLGLIIGRQGQAVGSMPWNVLTITNTIVDCNIFYRGRGTVFPLYLYPKTNGQQTIGQTAARTPNLNAAIVRQVANGLGLTFTHEPVETLHATSLQTPTSFAPIDLLDYIYAVLHSPAYREKYKEFLKIDFPRVPYPSTRGLNPLQIQEKFWQLVKLGGEIRQLHLLESPTVEKYITQYPIDGSNVVVKPKYENGNVYINETQYFANVPQVAWEFYIGGYQPAQKWLKDRKERTLEFDDILHYQKIIVALTETDRLMKEVDGVGVE